MKKILGLILIMAVTFSFAAALAAPSTPDVISGGIAATISGKVKGDSVMISSPKTLWVGTPTAGWSYALAFDSISGGVAGAIWLYAMDNNGVVIGNSRVDSVTVLGGVMATQYAVPFANTIIGNSYKLVFINAVASVGYFNRMYLVKRRTFTGTSASGTGGGLGN